MAVTSVDFGGFEDIFNTFFGGGGSRRRDPNAPRQGADLQYTMTLNLKKLFLVKKQKLKFLRKKIVILVMELVLKQGQSQKLVHIVMELVN